MRHFFAEFIRIVGANLAMIPAVIITLAAVGPLGAVLAASLAGPSIDRIV